MMASLTEHVLGKEDEQGIPKLMPLLHGTAAVVLLLSFVLRGKKSHADMKK